MIGYRFKGALFDSDAVLKSLDKATHRNLSRFGSFVRQTARRSMRRRKKPSRPGQPPTFYGYGRGVNLRLIFYAYERETQSVIIGPVRVTQGTSTPTGSMRAPELHEHGGSVLRKMSGKSFVTRRRDADRQVMAHYPPRPYMQPALEKESPKLPGLWENSLGR